MLNKFGINICGKTTNDKLVVNSIFKCYSTEGISFDVIFEVLNNKNYIPDWISIVEEAIAFGMKTDRIILMLDSAIADVYGKEFRDVIINRLKEKFICTY